MTFKTRIQNTTGRGRAANAALDGAPVSMPTAPFGRAFALCAGLWFLAINAGCIQLAGAWANLTGGDPIPAEFVPTKGPLLILIDDIEGQVSEPRAIPELHKTLSDEFLNNNVNKRVIPHQDWLRFRQANKNYDKLSIREIGSRLGADQVLYLRVSRFSMSDEPGADILRGRFEVRAKMLKTESEREVRLWPRTESGKLVAVATDPEPADGDRSASEIAIEMAGKLGVKVAKLFYMTRSLDK